jgi:hypothetical protein
MRKNSVFWGGIAIICLGILVSITQTFDLTTLAGGNKLREPVAVPGLRGPIHDDVSGQPTLFPGTQSTPVSYWA